jgi:hypothetical protein
VDSDYRRACVQQHGEYGEVDGREVGAGDDAETACEIAAQEDERELLHAGGGTPTGGAGAEGDAMRGATRADGFRRARDRVLTQHERVLGDRWQAARQPAERRRAQGVGQHEPLQPRRGRRVRQVLARADAQDADAGVRRLRLARAVEHDDLVLVGDRRRGQVRAADRGAQVAAVAPDQHDRQLGQARTARPVQVGSRIGGKHGDEGP